MIIQYISNLTIPLLLFYVLGYGLFCKVDIFDAFVDGVKDGFRVVVGVLPTLIGLMIAIGILRASGILGDCIGCSTLDGKSVFTGSIIAAFADQNDLVLRSNRTFARHL